MRSPTGQQRRAQIVQALSATMARKGYDGASIADVAAQAGLTPGLVHYHFKNKLEILLALLQSLTEQHDARLERRLEPCDDDPWRQLEAFIDFHLGLGADADPEVLACWIMLSGEALRLPEVREAYERAVASNVARAARIIDLGVQEGVFRCARVEEASCALVAIIQGYFVLAATTSGVIPRGSAASAARGLLRGLLMPQNLPGMAAGVGAVQAESAAAQSPTSEEQV